MERVRTGLGKLPQNLVADAAYGSEENYVYTQQKQMQNYLKYTTYYQDTYHYRNREMIQKLQFRAYNFEYDQEHEQFIGSNQKRLHFLYTRNYISENGFESKRRHYGCEDCPDCPLKSQCTQAKGNRQIQVNFELLGYHKQARENLHSEKGEALRKKRSVEVETVFGNIKQNMKFRRFHLRGLNKVNVELELVSIAHNMRRLAV